MNYRLLLLLVVVIVSCGETKEKEFIKAESNAESKPELAPLKIVDGGVRSFSLDNEANFESLIDLKFSRIDGREYFTFYSRNAHAIYLYDFETGDFVQKIKMEKEGPNAVNMFIRTGFFFHTMDSIFVNTTPHGIYLINSKGEVLDKKAAGKKPKGIEGLGSFTNMVDYNARKLYFNGGSRYVDGKIQVEIGGKIGEMRVNENLIFDFDKDSDVQELIKTEDLIHDYDKVARIKKEKWTKERDAPFTLSRYFSNDGEYTYGSTAISDSIYVFDGNELVKTIYAGKPDIDVANYSEYATIRGIKHFKNGMEAVENPKQPAHYKNTFMSPNGKLIYRVLYHGTKPKLVEGNDRAIPYVFGATLIVLNVETESLTYFDLPVDEIELRIPLNPNVFVNDNGIYFRVKDQENENEVQFRLFSVNQ